MYLSILISAGLLAACIKIFVARPIIAVTIDTVCRAGVADTNGTPTTTTLDQGSRPTVVVVSAAAAAVTSPATGRPLAVAQGPRARRRPPRRRNAPTADDDDSVQFPVTFKSADLFVVTKTKLYSTFSISMKVCMQSARYVHWFTHAPPISIGGGIMLSICLSVNASVHHEKFVSATCYHPIEEISPNFDG